MIPLERRKHFLAVVTKEEAEKRWRAALQPAPLGVEDVPIAEALGRVLGADLAARIDLPPFDRAVVDGFAVIASDTFGADEEKRTRLELASKALAAGDSGRGAEVVKGKAIEVATGAPVPRGANAVVMVENCEREAARATEGSTAVPAVLIGRAVVPLEGIQLAGVDVRSGETILRRGARLGARDTGVLAGQGFGSVPCFKRPRVAVISTGDELVAPGAAPSLSLGQIYDSNARIVCDLVKENGGEPAYLGIARDTREDLLAHFERAKAYDAIVLSGGTSKGAGDLTYRLIDELGKPGILVHGVAIKPGKPIVLAAWDRKPVAILPGFPASAAITFDVFVKPVLRLLAGLDAVEPRDRREASLAVSMPAGGGRHEFVLCNLVHSGDGLAAYPIIKGSGSVGAFAMADGFFEVPANRDRADRGERVAVTLLAAERSAADLVVIGSSDPLLDALLSLLRERSGLRAKVLATGSLAGLDAVARGEADLAPVHLLDPGGTYNEPQVGGRKLALVRGYQRRQGIVARDLAPLGSPPTLAKARALGWRLMNRNAGSGTRVLLDSILGAEAAGFPGYENLARSHEGAVAAVASGTADVTIAIESCARDAKLAFHPLRDEELDFAVARERLERPAVKAFVALLRSEEARKLVGARVGYSAAPGMGEMRLA